MRRPWMTSMSGAAMAPTDRPGGARAEPFAHLCRPHRWRCSAGQAQRVAHPPHGVDEGWLEAVDLLAQVAHVGLDDVAVAPEVVAPDVVQDLGLGEDPAGGGQEEAQQVELGGGEL